MSKINLYKGDYLESVCHNNNCEFYIVWDYGQGDRYSCAKIGMSHNVIDIPDDCQFIEFVEDTVIEKGLMSKIKFMTSKITQKYLSKL